MKKFIYLIIILCFSSECFSQVEPIYGMYRYNPLVISPAFAGKDTVSSITLMDRLQWIGVAGAPKTLGITGSLTTKNKSGFGVSFLQDKAGPMKNTSFGVDYAYHTALSKNITFSGGIRVSFNDQSLSLNGLKLIDANDPNFGQNITTGFRPNLGWGINLSYKNTFISISEPIMFRYNFNKYDINGNYKDYAHYYLMAGTSFTVSKGIRLKPSVMIRVIPNTPISADINLTATIQEKLDFGVSYRNSNSLGVQIGYLSFKKYYIGYMYELPISEMRATTIQTHELLLKYLFAKKQ
jgi:type IX secretion system PorP/SprF family membrane protein